MNTLLDRFCRYVRIHTQADETATTYPSSPGQLELGRLLTQELREMGLRDAEQDEHGIVLATVPATTSHDAPTIAWIAHVDTSPETSGLNVKPIVHANYDGERHRAARRPVARDPRRRQSGVGGPQRQDHHHHRRHDAARRRRQGRRGRHHGGGGAAAGPAGNAARPDPPLLHLRRGDRPRRRSRRSEEARRPRRLHARRRRPGRDRRRDLLRRPGRGDDRAASTSTRRSARAAWSTPCAWPVCSSTGCRAWCCRRKPRPTAKASCTPTASRAASPRRRSVSCYAISTPPGWPSGPRCCAPSPAR